MPYEEVSKMSLMEPVSKVFDGDGGLDRNLHFRESTVTKIEDCSDRYLRDGAV